MPVLIFPEILFRYLLEGGGLFALGWVLTIPIKKNVIRRALRATIFTIVACPGVLIGHPPIFGPVIVLISLYHPSFAAFMGPGHFLALCGTWLIGFGTPYLREKEFKEFLRAR